MLNGTHLLTQGDVIERLRELPAGSVQCVVTSPPYWGLRDYGTAMWAGSDPTCDHRQPATGGNPEQGPNKGNNNAEAKPYRDICGKCGAKRIDAQIGLEKTPEEYVEKMASVFREVRRVLRDDGTAWVNMGDSYANISSGGGGAVDIRTDGRRTTPGDKVRGRQQGTNTMAPGLKPKDLCGMPWRLAFALQADGWYLRSDIIWSKPNPMPESCTDRPTKAHEYLFLLTKRAKYYYDADAVRVEGQSYTRAPGHFSNDEPQLVHSRQTNMCIRTIETTGRNLRTVWHIPTQAYPDAHFATFPEKLVEPCVKAGTSEKGCCPKCGAGRVRVVDSERKPTRPARDNVRDDTGMANRDYERHVTTRSTTGWRPGCDCSTNGEPPRRCTVLDPFCGSGTVGVVACQLGRDFIGIDLSAEYLAMAERRIGKALKPSTYVDRTADVDAPLFVSV